MITDPQQPMIQQMNQRLNDQAVEDANKAFLTEAQADAIRQKAMQKAK